MPFEQEEDEVARSHSRKNTSLRTGAATVAVVALLLAGCGITQTYQHGYIIPEHALEQIPLGARIFTIADSLDAMISDRPYRKALPMSHAREEIRRCSGTQFDPKVVEVFMAIPEQHWVELRENLGSPFRLAHLKNLS